MKNKTKDILRIIAGIMFAAILAVLLSISIVAIINMLI